MATTTSSLAWRDFGMLLVVYGLLAAALWAIAIAGARAGRVAGFLGSLPLAAISLWHLHEQTIYYPGRTGSLLGVLILAALCSLVARRLRPTGSTHWTRTAAVAGGLAALFLLVTAGLYLGSNTFRWHLLRHNRLVGTPAYYLLSPPIDAIEAATWKAHLDPQLEPRASIPPAPEDALGPVSDAPNIIFVLLDTLRADQLAAYGGLPEVMPNLNRLAERSLVFGDVTVNATWTRPSMASFFTGLPPELHGAVDRHHALAPERVTLAEALDGMGYETAAFVSNYGAVGRGAGFAQGFDHFEEVKEIRFAYARAELVNKAIAQWLDGRRNGADAGPVFLYLHYLDPHTPHLKCDGECPSGTPADAMVSYRKDLQYLDAQLRWVLEDLPAALGDRRTVVLVTSDHGEEFGEHDEGGHGHSLYREVLAVPAILWTGSPRASRIDAKFEARDFFDLIVRIAADPELDVGAWARERARPARYASLNSTSNHALHRPYQGRVFMRALERDGLTFIWSAYGDTRELYDLAADPSERVNLARSREADVESMAREMDALVPHWVKPHRMTPTEETDKALKALGYIR